MIQRNYGQRNYGPPKIRQTIGLPDEVKTIARKISSGAVGASTGTLALSTSGSIPGLSASGITSGLASLGGGSMLAGIFSFGGIVIGVGHVTAKLIEKFTNGPKK